MGFLSTIDAPFSVGAQALLGSDSDHRIQTAEGITVWSGRGYSLFAPKHRAWDMPCPVGTPIYAPHSGEIVVAGGYGDCGITIGIARGDLRSDLCHLSQTKVFKGERVRKGDLVGLSGNTGNSDGAHLHWQMFRDGELVNPKNALRMAQMQGIMIGTAGVAGVAALLYWAVA